MGAIGRGTVDWPIVRWIVALKNVLRKIFYVTHFLRQNPPYYRPIYWSAPRGSHPGGDRLPDTDTFLELFTVRKLQKKVRMAEYTRTAAVHDGRRGRQLDPGR